MSLRTVQRVYQRYAPHYDRMFGALFDGGRRRAVRCAAGSGARRVLEVGVGTGLSLPYYPDGVRVVGVDACREMLAVARRRAHGGRLPAVEALMEMDAEHLAFADASFGAVVAMYVATVVPHPARLFAEMARVCAPGGTILVVNHFASEHPLVRMAERALAPLSDLVGFRTAYPLDALVEPEGVERVAVETVNALGLWKLVRYRRRQHVPSVRTRPRLPAHPPRVWRDDIRTGSRPPLPRARAADDEGPVTGPGSIVTTSTRPRQP